MRNKLIINTFMMIWAIFAISNVSAMEIQEEEGAGILTLQRESSKEQDTIICPRTGVLVLQGDLSETQNIEIFNKYVKSYENTYSGKIFNNLLYPHLSSLKEMSFTTTILSHISEDRARIIANEYINIAKKSGAYEVSIPITPCISKWRNLKRVNDPNFASNCGIVTERKSDDLLSVENVLAMDSSIIETWNRALLKTFKAELEFHISDMDSLASIHFSTAKLFEDKRRDMFGTIFWKKSLTEMQEKINDLSFMTHPLTLKFKDLKMRYISYGNFEEENFTISFTLIDPISALKEG